jgi:hypothetical protein
MTLRNIAAGAFATLVVGLAVVTIAWALISIWRTF